MADRKQHLYGVYRAYVTNSDDPTSSGRVQIRIPAVTGADTFRWALVATSTPAEGDTVILAFEEGDVDAPVVLGRLWSSTEPRG